MKGIIFTDSINFKDSLGIKDNSQHLFINLNFMKFILTKRKGLIPLNNISEGEFCMGKKCLEFKHSCYTVFESEEQVKDFIERKLFYLKEWIEKDIPEQAKNWGSLTEKFIAESKEKHEEILKAIYNLKIKSLN